MKSVKGIVIKAKMDKTIVVSVPVVVHHPKYFKSLHRDIKHHVHDPENRYKDKVGVSVTICDGRPISKTKSWIVVYD